MVGAAGGRWWVFLNSKKVVLYFPSNGPRSSNRWAPVSLLEASRLIASQGYDVKIYTSASKDLEERILEDCKGSLLFGVSAITGYQIRDGLRISRVVRRNYPDLKVVWGGWHPSLVPEVTIADQNVDIIVKGQGERTLLELCEALRRGLPLSGVDGIWFKEDGKVTRNRERHLEPMDNFPPLPLDLINLQDYVVEDPLLGRTFHLVTSVGCPHACGFCSEVGVNKRRWYGLSASRLCDEVESIIRRVRVDKILFLDSNFCVDQRRVQEFCREVIHRRIRVGFAGVNGTVRQLVSYRDETWRLMKEAGFVQLFVGIESADPEVLGLVDKRVTIKDTLALARKMKEFGLTVIYNFIVGLPRPRFSTLSRDQIEELLEGEIRLIVKLIKKIREIGAPCRFQIFTFTPYPGTPMASFCEELGFRPPTKLGDWADFDHYFAAAPYLSKEIARKVELLHYYYVELFETGGERGFMRRFLGKFNAIRWSIEWFSFPIDAYLALALYPLYLRLTKGREGVTDMRWV